MGLFDHFPYTNVHELNLDWVLSMMKALEAEWNAFIAGNSLTFADPMLHDITKTYAKNTIVLDGNGNAYVSLQAVPVGVGLQNGDYWLMVFDYEAFIEKVNKNFTARYYRGSYRATAAMAIGDWLTVDDVLCKATAAIAIDDVLELGVNIEHFTLEDFIKAFMQSANQLIQQYKNDIDASELAYRQQLALDVSATVASLQAQFDAAISGVTVDSEVINARVGADGITYPTLGDAIREQVSDLNETKSNNSIISLNFYDSSTITSGNRLNTSTGNLEVTTGWNVTDYIEVDPDKIYSWTTSDVNNSNICYYDASYTFISGGSTSTQRGQALPATAKYARLSVLTTDLSTFRFSIASNAVLITLGFAIKNGSPLDYIRDNIALRTKKAGTRVVEKTFTSITDFLMVLYSTKTIGIDEDTIVNIYLAEGTYTVTYSMLTTYLQNTYGITLPNNVNLIGLGKGATISLDLTGQSAAIQSAVSAINFYQNNHVENMTFIINNGRYALHNDSGGGYTDFETIVKDCTFIHSGNSDGGWLYPAAVGEGTSSGAHVVYENCKFISPDRAYYLHNNTGFTKPSLHEFSGCTFNVTNEKLSFQIETLGSTVRDKIIFDNCSFNNVFQSNISNSADPSIISCDFEVFSNDCELIAENWAFSDGNHYYIKSPNVIETINNTGNTVAPNTPIKFANGWMPLTSGDNEKKVIGVSGFHNTAANDVIDIHVGGYINVTGLTSTVGDLIGVDSNGDLAVVTQDPIAIVKFKNNILNRTYAKLII